MGSLEHTEYIFPAVDVFKVHAHELGLWGEFKIHGCHNSLFAAIERMQILAGG